MPASTTSITVGAGGTQGAFAITDGTTTVIGGGGGYNYVSSEGYYWMHGLRSATLSGMSSSVAKVIELYSCNAGGTPGGQLHVIGLLDSSSDVDAIDISGISTLYAVAAFSSTAYASTYTRTGPAYNQTSTLPGNIREVRAVGTEISYSTGGGGPTSYAPGGLDIAGQNLDATALDQLYTDLASVSSGTNPLIVRDNPGTSSDTPSIATAKGYTVYGS